MASNGFFEALGNSLWAIDKHPFRKAGGTHYLKQTSPKRQDPWNCPTILIEYSKNRKNKPSMMMAISYQNSRDKKGTNKPDWK